MSPSFDPNDDLQARRRRSRRTALWIGVAALAVYATFIVINVPRP